VTVVNWIASSETCASDLNRRVDGDFRRPVVDVEQRNGKGDRREPREAFASTLRSSFTDWPGSRCAGRDATIDQQKGKVVKNPGLASQSSSL
jgi:hypothetical protein